jgi:RNA polymerase sigma-70 factor (ECF subfamily)
MTDLATPNQAEGQEAADAAHTRSPRRRAAGPVDVEKLLEQHRGELTGYCYRMLGSAFEADDAVQSTMERAWRGFARFDGRNLRSWLYRIATNVCIDMLNGRRRRARPTEVGESWSGRGQAGAEQGDDGRWVWPAPDGLVLPTTDGGDPADAVVSRESIRLAFVAALQHLQPRQRAVLILRDVLRWKASEVADLLGTTVVAVNSTLQRARATLATRDLTAVDPWQPYDDEQRQLLERYVAAMERFDIESLVTMLHADATLSMPPSPLWVHGRLDICRWFLEGGSGCRGSRLVPTVANGSPAFGMYRPRSTGDGYDPFAIQVVEISAGRIRSIEAYIDPGLFSLFDLPPHPFP